MSKFKQISWIMKNNIMYYIIILYKVLYEDMSKEINNEQWKW